VRIDIVVYDGVDELDALGPLEVLRSAAAAGASISVRLLTRIAQESVSGAFGLRFCADDVFSVGADVVIVPGGGWVNRSDRGAWGEVQRGHWLPLLGNAARSRSVMASVCTGALLLAHAGVVGGRRATTHHAARADLAALGADVVEDRVVDDGDLVTSGGVTSGLDLALWLVERFAGRDLADTVARRMEYASARPELAGR
jgi:transcriptional regulator GlxA family with amidase domain